MWDRLASGIVPPKTIAKVAEDHLSLYQELLGQGVSAGRAPEQVAA
jgi:hypothetical protein